MTAFDGLVGDIGGTHARFALADVTRGRPVLSEPKTFANKDYPSVESAIEAYLAQVDGGHVPVRAVLAVAGPVADGAADFTNSDWEVSETKLRRDGGFKAARLINDFAAQALGAPRVSVERLARIGPDAPGVEGCPIAVMGPGTGFGLAGLLNDAGHDIVLSTEGGHAGFAPVDEVEVEIWRRFALRHGRVSVERILCGQGLYELYVALADIEGAPALLADERQVQAAAGVAGDPLAARAVERFCQILGSVAGDITLTLGARGGVYITGGVAQRLADAMVSGGFRERFEAKGRFRDYLAEVPTYLILEPYTALIGAASVLSSLETV